MTDVLAFTINGLNGRKAPLTYSLDRHVNVFFGPNGCGKTSVLKILHSAMENQPETIANVAFQSASVTINSVTFKRKFVLSYERPDQGRSVRADVLPTTLGVGADLVRRQPLPSQNRNWITEPVPGDQTPGWMHTYLATTRLYEDDEHESSLARVFSQSLGASEANAVEEALDKSFANSLQSLWSAKYGDILGSVRTTQQEALQNILLEVLAPEDETSGKRTAVRTGGDALDANRAFERMSNFLKRQSNKRIHQALGSKDQFVARYGTDPRLRRIVSQIDIVEERIEGQMRPIQQLSDLVKRLFLGGKSLSFDGPRIGVVTDSSTTIGLERLSSGEKHLIRIFVAALNAGPSALLIDEPELSMHIDWQRELIKNIRLLNSDCQLILATHSPEIMAEVPDENIFRI